MKIKDLISVIEGNAAMNNITESKQRLYMRIKVTLLQLIYSKEQIRK